jgi:carboxypeptidase Taq
MPKSKLAKKQTPYDALCALAKRANTLEGISSFLSWDQETYMPEKAAPIRAEQRKILAELAHSTKTGPEFEERLKVLIDLKSKKIKVQNLSDAEEASVRVFARDFIRERALPTSFVEEFTQLTSESIFLWAKAKGKNDFRLFRPNLEKIVDMVRKKADLIGGGAHPYDALLDEFEPGTSTKQVDAVFSELKAAIKTLLKKIPPFKGKEIKIASTKDEQLAVCHEVLELINFDFTCGRLDLSAHPFSSSYHPYDSRITTRQESENVVVQVLTTLHEAGHSFYEMGLPVKEHGTPLGQAISLGIHESQSRFWETRIGRSKGFWQFMFPKLQNRFKKQLSGVSIEQFMASLNLVRPSFIRTDADEVTYPLHVILRFEIEKELVTGKLKVKDLPERWNEMMVDLLGIKPPKDALGCLQDIHWSMGAFGYFPTYSLGNVYAAQMFETFAKKFPDWEKRISHGEFAFIKDWLAKNVWQHGRRYDGKALIRNISGSELSAKPFINYLNKKYLNK